MSDIPSFPYEWLWGERTICSVANLTRRDGDEFLALAPKVPVRTSVVRYRLDDADTALGICGAGAFQGRAVLDPVTRSSWTAHVPRSAAERPVVGGLARGNR